MVGGLALVGAVIGGVWFMKRRAKQNRQQVVTVAGVAVQMTTPPAADTHPTNEMAVSIETPESSVAAAQVVAAAAQKELG